MAYLYDINDLNVTIADSVSPLVILFGPRACGKTMTLVRLTRWLESQGYNVIQDRIFRPSFDGIYQNEFEDFRKCVYGGFAAPLALELDCRLFKVIKKGRTICQILDLPGIHCQDSTCPSYIEKIMNVSNPKIFIFYVEASWADAVRRDAYVEKILNMHQWIIPSDKVIFACPKADLLTSFWVNGQPYTEAFFRKIKSDYPDIFSPFVKTNPITKLWRKYNFDFVVFSAGTFFDAQDGSTYYQQGPDSYPANLWKSIMKAVRKMK